MRQCNRYNLRILAIVISLFIFFLLAGSEGAAAQMASHHMQTAASSKAGKVIDIVRDPGDVPSPVGNRGPTVVHVELTAKEVTGELDPASGTTYRYWTFNGKLPAPMIRVRQGDTVQVTLHNEPSSHMAHSVDFHAALGPGGGAAYSQAVPGQTKTFTFQATTPGLFVYHCGTPMVAEHIANGMYGLILVEPAGGLPHVDHEYYVVQGEIYTTAPKGKAGLQQFSEAKLMAEDPEYFVFNGAVDALMREHPLNANVGDTVRIFFGDAGPNKPSSLHVVGEMFTQEFEAGSLTSPPLTNVQTALVAPGSAAILQLKAVEPGQFNFMDHAMARMAKGLMATLEVTGAQNAALMRDGPASPQSAPTVAAMTQSDIAAANSKGDVDPGSVSVRSAVVANTTPDEGGMRDMNAMRMGQGAASPARRAKILPSSVDLSKSASFPTELNGCLTMQSDGMVLIRTIGLQRTYRLEAQPLLFAENANRLVHLSGHLGSVLAEEHSNVPSFVVDTVDELAPSCTARISPPLLRAASAKSAGVSSGLAVTVGMTDMAFMPAKIMVKAGQKVVWKNSSQVIHNVVDDANKAMNKADVQLPEGVKPFGSDFLQPGQTFSEVFTKPGTYRYVCTLHESGGMKGTVIVRP